MRVASLPSFLPSQYALRLAAFVPLLSVIAVALLAFDPTGGWVATGASPSTDSPFRW